MDILELVMAQIKAATHEASCVLMHRKDYIAYRVRRKPYDMATRLRKRMKGS